MNSDPQSKKLDCLTDWLAERFVRHAGSADVIRQELAQKFERTVAPLRRELAADRDQLACAARWRIACAMYSPYVQMQSALESCRWA